jgi:tripartite-type tricarboxylate transporter receptor subunit TctC
MPELNRMAFYGVLGPKGMPKELVNTINSALVKVLSDVNVKRKIEDTGSIVIGNTPEAFSKQISEEYRVYRDVVKRRNITLD